MAIDGEQTLLGAEETASANDPDLSGPFPVGDWAKGFKKFLAERPRVLLIGEVFNLKRARTSTYFELRDADGAAPCAIWNNDLDRLKLPEGALKDGAEVVIAGGPDYYPGSQTASPGFSFRATYIRLAGEGDLLAQLEKSRRRLEADGLLTKQRALPRPLLPRTIGVVTARNSAACADLLAGLERRGWRGTIVWADAPVQDRRAAGAIGAALRGLAQIPEVEVAVVCRGGGSLTDLWAFCDENLCRTVAMLRLPVISAVGHEVDRTLIDEVAAVSCSTPTHAAEALIQLDVNAARAELRSSTTLAARAGTAAVSRRAQRLAECSRAPTRSLDHERKRLHQMLREIRASAGRRIGERRGLAGTHALVVKRRVDSFAAARAAALKRLDALTSALGGHDPERTLARGYALVADREGEPVASARAARERGEVVIRFADDAVGARINRDPESDGSDEHT
jgi:exodeoxyribonuclease VII large subunit